VNPCKRLADNHAAAEIPRLQGGVFARRALTVIVLGHDEPLDAVVAPALRELGYARCGAVDIVGDVDFIGGGVDGADERVLRDIGQVAFVFEPGTGRRDGVSCALAFDFVQDAEARELGGGEGGEGVKERETRGLGVYVWA
jgi:hypothetical protein